MVQARRKLYSNRSWQVDGRSLFRLAVATAHNHFAIPALDALQEIQRTGDIFFPGYWLTGLLSGHHSDEAKALVKQWIGTHADLEPALMNKLKENAYWLLR